MKFPLLTLLPLSLLVHSVSAVDTDGDGLDDSVETNTGVYVSETNTGTDPNNADTDGDGVPDGLEIIEGTDPTDTSDFQQFRIIEGSFTREEAIVDAVSRGGRLAVLNSQEKIELVRDYLLSLGTWPILHIGLYEEGEGNWFWLTGESLGESNWATSRRQPSDRTRVNNLGMYFSYPNSYGVNTPSWDDQAPHSTQAYLLETLSSVDTDGDGLDDSVETNTGVYVSETNTGTDPNNADTDGDGVPDGLETTEGTDPNDPNDFNSFSTGLVAYYPFDGNANDESGNDLNGFLEGPVSTTDRFGQATSAFDFDGADDFISLGDPDELDMSYTSYTYSVWFKTDTTNENLYILSKYETYGTNSFGIGTSGAGFLYYFFAGDHISSNETGISNVAINDGKWHNATLVINLELNRFNVFLDGLLIEERSFPVTEGIDNDYPLLIGKIVDGQNFEGTIDDVRIYDRALSKSEVSALYYSEAPQFEIIEGNFTWHEAKADAEARGGRLAVLNTQEKIDSANEYLLRIGEWPHTWIGLTDEVETDSWIWLDGSNLSVSNWGSIEPNNSWENYAGIWDAEITPPKWADFSSTHISGAYLLETLPPEEALAPVLPLNTFYESNSSESITIDATPSDGYPTNYTYQWYFKVVGSSSYFVIPSNFGGTAANYQISGNSGYNGTWKVEVTNDAGTTTAEFNYRVYADSDSDGLSDGQEEFVLGTDPNDNDSDDDTLLDGAETNTGTWVSSSDTGTNPLSDDSDNDTLLDGAETNTAEYVDASDTGTDPNNSDTDGDGLLDGVESNSGTYVDSSDAGTDPLNNDSDFDGILDGYETATGSWTSNEDTGTNPTKADSDADGLSDGVETNSGVFIGLSDTGTNPNNTDSDGDGFTDKFEVDTSYDPTSTTDTPDAYSFIETAVEVNFYGAIGGTYRIEHAEDLESDSWVTVEDGIEGSSELIERLYSTDEYSRRFFRVVRTDQ